MEVFATRAWKPERKPQIIFHHPGVVDDAYKASAEEETTRGSWDFAGQPA